MLLTLLLSSLFTLVELNCENLFDTYHNPQKQDALFTPNGKFRWTKSRYWTKIDNIAHEIISACDDAIPDMVALCEVENDTVMHDLTKRSLLHVAGYDYVMTSSPDPRGINVALMYSPYTFKLLHSHSIRVEPVKNMRPTRDILYVNGVNVANDTLHIFVVHAPSQYGGKRYSRLFRKTVADRLCQAVDSVQAVSPEAHIIVAGDFNDEYKSPALKSIYRHHLHNLTKDALGQNGVRGTYRYKGKWGSIDHILGSSSIQAKLDTTYIHSPLFLLQKDESYGGYYPLRSSFYRFRVGFSDHLPLVARFRF